MRIEALEIGDHILDKIESRHRVQFREVEEACSGEQIHIRRGRDDLYKVFSRTATGRFLLVVLADQGDGLWRVVTAREMTDTERRLFQREVGE